MNKLFLFFKRNLSVAFKSVKNGKKQFFPFILAIFLITTVFFTLTMAFDNNKSQREDKIRETYDYHILISGLREKEFNVLKANEDPVALNQKTYEIVETVYREDSDGKAYHFDLYLMMARNEQRGIFGFLSKDSPEDIFKDFESQYHKLLYKSDYKISISHSPLYDLEENGSDRTGLYITVTVACSLLSIFVLSALYSVRLNHYKFIYGIYSTFGADFKKLRRSAFYELLVLFLITVLPAYVVSLILSFALYLGSGLSFSLSFFSSLKVILFLIPILFISTRIPMRVLSRTEPIRLIVSENNENWVSHRGRSVSLINSKFPAKYEFHTALRFRRYLFRLALNSAVFSILFCFGVYLSLTYTAERKAREINEYEYALKFKNAAMLNDPELQKVLLEYRENGTIRDVQKNYPSVLAEDSLSHMLVSRDNVGLFAGLLKTPKTDATPDEKTYAVSRLQYFCATDSDLLRIFDDVYGIDHTGEISTFFDKPNSVVLAKTLNNREIFDYKVGDTVWLAAYHPIYFEDELAELKDPSNPEKYDPNAYIDNFGNLMTKDEEGKDVLLQGAPYIRGELAGTELLKTQIETFKFEYIPFIVSGIIENYSTAENGIPVILNSADYAKITGEEITSSDTLYISIANDAKNGSVDALESDLRQFISGKDVSLTATGKHFKNSVESLYRYDLLIILLAAIVLIFIPIIWFFTQILFYKKRENEFYILQAIAADISQIRNLHLFNAVLMLPVGILSLLLSLAVTAIFYYVKNSFWSVLFGTESLLTTQFYMPPIAFAIVFAICFLCSFLSSLFPYLSYKNKKKASHEKNDIIFYAE